MEYLLIGTFNDGTSTFTHSKIFKDEENLKTLLPKSKMIESLCDLGEGGRTSNNLVELYAVESRPNGIAPQIVGHWILNQVDEEDIEDVYDDEDTPPTLKMIASQHVST